MSQTPTNQRLYAMVVFQAKQRYRVYPSPGASHWVHSRYLELGGKFIDSSEERRKKEIIKHIIESRQQEEESHRDRDSRHKNDKHHSNRSKDR